METLYNLKLKINSTNGLKKVITTMKNVASVNVRKYEKIAFGLSDYENNLNTGFQGVIRAQPQLIEYFDSFDKKYDRKNCNKHNLYIIIGSNQGLCGKFNNKIYNYYYNNFYNDKDCIFVIGSKLNDIFKSKKIPVDNFYNLTISVEGIFELINDIIKKLNKFIREGNINKLSIIYTKHGIGDGIAKNKQLLPLDNNYFKDLKKKQWPTNILPRIDDIKNIFFELIKQYIFINLYYSFISSITTENKNRLKTLESSEKNIKDYINDLKLLFNKKRQEKITLSLINNIFNIKKNKKE